MICKTILIVGIMIISGLNSEPLLSEFTSNAYEP